MIFIHIDYRTPCKLGDDMSVAAEILDTGTEKYKAMHDVQVIISTTISLYDYYVNIGLENIRQRVLNGF
jgi:hypothetical protein